MARIFGPFDFEGIDASPPNRTFSGELELAVGDRRVSLLEVGPAHTAGDVVVHPGAVAILAIRADGAVALLRQYRATFDDVNWELPAGTLDVAGESTAVIRSSGPARVPTGSRRAIAYWPWSRRWSFRVMGLWRNPPQLLT